MLKRRAAKKVGSGEEVGRIKRAMVVDTRDKGRGREMLRKAKIGQLNHSILAH